ncbi:LysR family transcriptional regulator [Luteolibacter yonseiensis]|uniref:LysR family transcriptional regulator n=1 Tax=Luteolibacter yonseiensis TaxID=1144680 RepID=A0A934R114_9BACT|nr:LysR family transcriptional regulator [Luteolibacter yonseiensis]MBK1814931.1 LysR family transcriptional regulator [Luteolibacter yonseiensis]
MNIHHLELFYHVARCRGVSAAARQMPYGIQQPAISAQILQLENSLGKALFHRRPFALTVEGEALFAFVEPFFAKLPMMAERLRGGADNSLRISCPEIVQRDYLPALLSGVRARVPGFHFSLESGRIEEIENNLRGGKIDLGLATSAGPKENGIDHRELLRMPLLLLVREDDGPCTAAEILGQDRIEQPLITLPRGEPSVAAFQQELQRRNIEWYPTLELASLDLVARFVTEGYGTGLVLDIPGAVRPPGVRTLPLSDFPEVRFYALTSGNRPAMVELFIAEAEKVIEGFRGK